MNIINANLSFRNGLTFGNNPKMVIMHHAEAKICSIEDVHRELYSTDCPGKNFLLDRIKREAAGSSCKLIYPGYLMKINSSIKDNNVKAVQDMLISKGYSVGMCGADGYFGENTFEAVKRFQSNNGLMVDGIVGRDTWSSLIN